MVTRCSLYFTDSSLVYFWNIFSAFSSDGVRFNFCWIMLSSDEQLVVFISNGNRHWNEWRKMPFLVFALAIHETLSFPGYASIILTKGLWIHRLFVSSRRMMSHIFNCLEFFSLKVYWCNCPRYLVLNLFLRSFLILCIICVYYTILLSD